MRGVATKESKFGLKLKDQYINCKISCFSLHSTTCKKKKSHLSLHFLFPLLRQEERYTAGLISLNSNFHFEFYRIRVELFTESSLAANITQLQKLAQTVSLFIIGPWYQHIRL